jgi:Copper binding periplasmic protein CusF
MKRVLRVLLVLLVACSADDAPKPLSEPGEKLYVVRGVILSRDATSNTIHVDHERIPGFMEAMKMDYSVRGTKVGALPPDKKRIEAKLHVTDRGYWLTDVRAIP